jgi:hypothetical protein
MSRHNVAHSADCAPLFDWPPLTASGAAMSKDQRWKKKKSPEWERLSIMGLALLFGMILIFSAGHIGEPFWKSGLEHLGTAVFIAALLGLTIHIWLERQLTENVFSAAMGYELPDELKDEIKFVYGNRIICEDHSQSMQIEDLKNGFVRVTIGTQRKFINIAQTEQELSISLGMDEWNVKGHPSVLLEIDYKFENKEKIAIYPDGNFEISERPEGSLVKAKENIKLASKQSVTVFTKCSETKPVNSDHLFHYAYATLNPRVTVKAPGFNWLVAFSHRDEPHRERYSDTVILDGLLLPHQSIRVRWWPEITA